MFRLPANLHPWSVSHPSLASVHAFSLATQLLHFHRASSPIDVQRIGEVTRGLQVTAASAAFLLCTLVAGGNAIPNAAGANVSSNAVLPSCAALISPTVVSAHTLHPIEVPITERILTKGIRPALCPLSLGTLLGNGVQVCNGAH